MRLQHLVLILALISACSDSNDKGKDSRVADTGLVGDGGQRDSSVDGHVGPQIGTLVPQGNAVTGWAEDTTKDGITGPNAAYIKTDIEGIINGEQDPYAALGCNGFAREYYTKDFGSGCKATLDLKIWDMATTAGAQQMYNTKKTRDETEAFVTFEATPDVQTAGVIGYDSPAWRVHAYKSYYVLRMNTVLTDASCKDAAKADTITWAKTITQNLP